MTEPLSGPEPTPPPAWEQAESRFDPLHDRKAAAVLVVGLAAVAAFGAFVVVPLLPSSSSTSTAGGLVANAHHPRVHAALTPTPTSTPSPMAVPTTAPALHIRDPFSPRYAPAAATGGGGGAGATPAPSGSAGRTSATPAPSTNTIVLQQPQPTVTTTVRTTSAKYSLVLRKVLDPKADEIQVTLNGKPYDLFLGDIFPDGVQGPFRYVRLVTFADATKDVATFQYGDSTFSMGVGETQTES